MARRRGNCSCGISNLCVLRLCKQNRSQSLQHHPRYCQDEARGKVRSRLSPRRDFSVQIGLEQGSWICNTRVLHHGFGRESEGWIRLLDGTFDGELRPAVRTCLADYFSPVRALYSLYICKFALLVVLTVVVMQHYHHPSETAHAPLVYLHLCRYEKKRSCAARPSSGLTSLARVSEVSPRVMQNSIRHSLT